MNELITYLKTLRKNKQISLKNLAKKLNTTDAILSRLENGTLPKNTPELFSSIASFYGINVITLYLKANLISKEDLNEYNGIFTNCSKLSSNEINHIQDEIDFIINIKEENKRTNNIIVEEKVNKYDI